jgi:hypothetical protein
MKPHHDKGSVAGAPVGRDPRSMSVADLEAAGRPRISRGDAIRAKCLDCCCGAPAEVRRCAMIDCALWPFRMGTDPYREPMGEERRAAAGARLSAGRQNTA